MAAGTDGSFYFASLALIGLTAKGYTLISVYRMDPTPVSAANGCSHGSNPVPAGGTVYVSWKQSVPEACVVTGSDVPGCRRGAAEGHLFGRHAIAYRRAGRPVNRDTWLGLPRTLPAASVADCALPGCGLQAGHTSRPLSRAPTLRW